MAKKSQTSSSTSEAPSNPSDQFAHLQEAGLGNLMEMSTAWVEAISDMNAEVAGFVAERIKEDVKTQQEILQCSDVADLQHIQAQFIQKAMDQYQSETGKLVEMSTQAFAQKSEKR